MEPLQIVSYTRGQKFETHHDAGTLLDDGSVQPVPPRRLVTLFLYLNTLPEGQGHTEFPALGISVKPERGCGVLFCNVMPDGTIDGRTQHRAAPVFDRLYKYGVNVWITDTNFQELATAGIRGAVTKKELKEFCSKYVLQGEASQDDKDKAKGKGMGKGRGVCESKAVEKLQTIESALQHADRLCTSYESEKNELLIKRARNQ